MNYKDAQNNLYFIDPDFAHLLPEGCVQITEEEAITLRPKPYVPTYKDLRAQDYPSIADQLDSIFHVGLDGWKATIQAVKDKYPKV
jgi:GTP-dependent phosphoenolpyruvate carboxykinase